MEGLNKYRIKPRGVPRGLRTRGSMFEGQKGRGTRLSTVGMLGARGCIARCGVARTGNIRIMRQVGERRRCRLYQLGKKVEIKHTSREERTPSGPWSPYKHANETDGGNWAAA